MGQYAIPYNYNYMYFTPLHLQQAYWHAMHAQADYSYASAIAEQEWAMAQLQWQHANRAYMQNELTRVNTYWEMKKVIKENQPLHEKKPFIGEARARAIRAQQPKPLDANQIDAAAGRITWPKQLCVKKYASYCEKIEQAFFDRSRVGIGEQVAIESQITEYCKSLRQMIKEDIRSMKPDSYLECVSFIESLDHETSRPIARHATVASR